jgi:hypothetical protein
MVKAIVIAKTLKLVILSSNNMVKEVNLQKAVGLSLELFQYIGIVKLNDHFLNVL